MGGGVVGLAVAQRLALRPATTTLLLERNAAVACETSARNSGVLHAGLYYGADSLKARLCVAGARLLYDLCARHRLPCRRTGKWIVAQTEAQAAALQAMDRLGRLQLGFETRWLPAAEVAAAAAAEGVRAAAGVLESPNSGIIDPHPLALCLLGLFEEAGGVTALNSTLVDVRPLGSPPGAAGWRLSIRDPGLPPEQEPTEVTAETIVNAAGLGAVAVHNMIVPPARRLQPFFAKGNYFSYAAPHPRPRRLIYPAPEPGAGGLGTHLTLDMAGRVRFGPDVEPVDRPDDLSVNPARLPQAVRAIKQYLPQLDESRLRPDYAGIRPKLSPHAAATAGTGFQDFVIRREAQYEGCINLLGIESPGLTSCLAIAHEVETLLYGSLQHK